MGWRDRVAKFFVPPASSQKTIEREPSLEELTAPSIAWAGEYGLGLGPITGIKYNPDDLMGRKGFGIYKRMIMDEQVKSAMYFKRSTITGRDWMFALDSEKVNLSETECNRRCDLYTEMVSKYRGSFTDGLNAIMKALWQGFSFTEQLFDTFEFDKKTYWGLAELKPKPFDTFYPYVDDKGQVIRWTQRGGYQQREIDIPMEKFVYYKFNPDFDEHYGGSDLRAAYRAYVSKDLAIRYLNIFMERLAGGFIVASPDGDHSIVRNSQEWKDLTSILSNVTGKTSMLLPAGVTVDVHQPSGGSVTLFKEAIELHDQAIGKAALVPNLLGMSAQGHHGSYSQSDTQFDVFMIISDDEAGRLEESLNEQVFAPLAAVNFADGIAPRFQFKPLNNRRIAQILDMWTKLATAKAVQPSDSDEAHIRDLIEFPEKTTLLEPPVPVAVPAQGLGPPSSPAGSDNQDPAAPKGKGGSRDQANRGKKLKSELKKAAFKKAEQRVAFSVIGRQTDIELQRHRQSIERALASGIADSVKDLRRSDLNEMNVGKFKLDGAKNFQLNTQVKQMLQTGMEIGKDHGMRELDLAKGVRFAAKRLDMQRLGDMAADWLKQKAFTISGDISNGATREIKHVLVDALKNTWSDGEIKERIYTALVDKGYLGSQEAADALTNGDLTEVGNILGEETEVTPSRLDTVIRTNMFEAINEARLDMFTDPDLKDFVTGLEYSAILDGRTTPLCREMDGHAWESSRWEDDMRPWVPPNHFNCRSILVPVTTSDDTEFEEDVPSNEPVSGFG